MEHTRLIYLLCLFAMSLIVMRRVLYYLFNEEAMFSEIDKKYKSGGTVHVCLLYDIRHYVVNVIFIRALYLVTMFAVFYYCAKHGYTVAEIICSVIILGSSVVYFYVFIQQYKLIAVINKKIRDANI